MPNRTLGLRQLNRQAKRHRAEHGDKPMPPYWRPKTRGDCFRFGRPCPFISCNSHLFLDTLPNGGIHFTLSENIDDLWRLKESCALDVADRGALPLEEIGQMVHLTRERIRQIEAKASASLRVAMKKQQADLIARWQEPEVSEVEELGLGASSNWPSWL